MSSTPTTQLPNTYFASAKRAEDGELVAQIAVASDHEVTDTVLQAFGGIVLILNAERQIVAVNATVLGMLGIDNPRAVLGLRPGEAFGCVFVRDAPGGCGTGKRCRTCGAVIAILASQEHGKPVQRECMIEAEVGGKAVVFEFSARASPVKCRGHRLTILTLQDISAAKERDLLQRVFLHDITNLLSGLRGASLCLASAADEDSDDAGRDVLLGVIREVSERLMRDVYVQRHLRAMLAGEFEPTLEKVCLRDVLAELKGFYLHHEAAEGRALSLPDMCTDVILYTDRCLLFRVLCNMITNALEATATGGTVRVTCELEDDASATVYTWNDAAIADEVAARVFGKHFTTKPGTGRGLGTYSMKLITERYLSGRVSFTTSRQGTVFCLQLPLEPRSP